MPHRHAAGLIVFDPEDRLALVRHVKSGVYDFSAALDAGFPRIVAMPARAMI